MKEKIVIIDNVRSAHNVGSIFRTADGAGVSKIYLLGSTPTPVDRFGREQVEIQKTSLGATKTVDWEHIGLADSLSTESGLDLIQNLQQEGFLVVAVEQSTDSVFLNDFSVPDNVAYIFGAEVDGIQKEFLETTDVIVEIPMEGKKESLNVSVTAGIILFLK